MKISHVLTAISCAASTLENVDAAVILTGTVGDFCALSVGSTCTRLTDFEGAVPGVVTGMVGSTLSGDLPTAGAPNRVSEPANLALLGLGPAGLASFTHRRR